MGNMAGMWTYCVRQLSLTLVDLSVGYYHASWRSAGLCTQLIAWLRAPVPEFLLQSQSRTWECAIPTEKTHSHSCSWFWSILVGTDGGGTLGPLKGKLYSVHSPSTELGHTWIPENHEANLSNPTFRVLPSKEDRRRGWEVRETKEFRQVVHSMLLHYAPTWTAQ